MYKFMCFICHALLCTLMELAINKLHKNSILTYSVAYVLLSGCNCNYKTMSSDS